MKRLSFRFSADRQNEALDRMDGDRKSQAVLRDAHNRSGFALGAVLAAEYTLTHQGLLTMDDLFK